VLLVYALRLLISVGIYYIGGETGAKSG